MNKLEALKLASLSYCTVNIPDNWFQLNNDDKKSFILIHKINGFHEQDIIKWIETYAEILMKRFGMESNIQTYFREWYDAKDQHARYLVNESWCDDSCDNFMARLYNCSLSGDALCAIDKDTCIRRVMKKPMKIINGHEVVLPMTEKPEMDQEYYYGAISSDGVSCCYTKWVNDAADIKLFKLGIFTNEKDAVAFTKALYNWRES